MCAFRDLRPRAGLNRSAFFERMARFASHPAGALIALLVSGVLTGCNGGSGAGGGVAGNGGAPPPPTPTPMQPNTRICICPGGAGRIVTPCPGTNPNGELIVKFTCSPTSAVFLGQCNYLVNSDNQAVLQLLPVDNIPVNAVPVSPPSNPYSVVFNTIAHVGTANVSFTDLADNSVHPVGQVTVSNTCQ